ncbi:hypothetical protein ACHAXM_000573 [Skeletonema potamos]
MDQGKPDLDCMMYYLLFLVENMYSTKIVFLFFQSEVEYAKFLIEEFDSGLTKDLKTGHTKRSFLSEKLMCAPMRVSKKFPGPSIGKATFSRASIGEDGNPLPKKVFEGYEIRHNALRIKFLRKILSSELKILLDMKVPFIADSLPSSAIETAANKETPSPAMMLPVQQFQGPISVQAYSTAPLTNTVNPVPCVMKPCPPSVPSAGPPFFFQHEDFDKSAMSRDRKSKSILYAVEGSKFGNFRPDHNDIPDLLSGFDKHAASLLEQKAKHIMSGFDKHAASLLEEQAKYVSFSVPTKPSDNDAHIQATDHPLFVGPIGESPYITSKSFDDLHQCLATNQIPHLDLDTGHSLQQDEQKRSVPLPPVACGVPIQVSTNNGPSAFTPYYTQPMQMVSFMPPQLQTQMVKQCIPVQQFKNVAALPTVQVSGNGVDKVVPPQKSFGALSLYTQNGTHAPISNDAVSAATLGGGTTKRSHDETDISFHSLLSEQQKRYKSSHAVSTASGSSEPSSSDGGFESELVLSSYENSSASSKDHSKQSSNNSDSSETD